MFRICLFQPQFYLQITLILINFSLKFQVILVEVEVRHQVAAKLTMKRKGQEITQWFFSFMAIVMNGEVEIFMMVQY